MRVVNKSTRVGRQMKNRRDDAYIHRRNRQEKVELSGWNPPDPSIPLPREKEVRVVKSDAMKSFNATFICSWRGHRYRKRGQGWSACTRCEAYRRGEA